jgi:hypothetical protein
LHREAILGGCLVEEYYKRETDGLYGKVEYRKRIISKQKFEERCYVLTNTKEVTVENSNHIAKNFDKPLESIEDIRAFSILNIGLIQDKSELIEKN